MGIQLLYIYKPKKDGAAASSNKQQRARAATPRGKQEVVVYTQHETTPFLFLLLGTWRIRVVGGKS